MTLAVYFIFRKMWIVGTILYSCAPLTSVARAAFCDIHVTNQRDPNVIDTFLVESLPWIFAPVIFHSNAIFFLYTVIIGCCLILCSIFFQDWVDRGANKFSIGLLEAPQKYGLKTCLVIISAFAVLQIAYNILETRFDNIAAITNPIHSSSFLLGIGFFLGAIIARLLIRRKKVFLEIINTENKKSYVDNYYKLIITISISLAPFLLILSAFHWYINGQENEYLFSLLPGLTLLGGLFIPTLYAFFGSRVSFHSLGLLYAFIEITNSLSEFFGELLQGLQILSSNLALVSSVILLTFISFLIIMIITIKNKDTQFHDNTRA